MKNIFLVGIGLLSASLVPATLKASDLAAPVSATTESSAGTRYGLFNGLDHRSAYGVGVFPEPFLVDDSDLEPNEFRLDWLHTRADNQHRDSVKVEVEKGFGQLTLELEVPYERSVADGETTKGFDNVNLGARYPLYQFVSAKGFIDTTFGAAVEAGIPVQSAVSKNAELVSKVFNDLRLGEHFTLQSVLGHSILFGPQPDGGLQTFEYGLVFGYTIPHRQFPIPEVLEFIPVFELRGETVLNQDSAGHNRLLGNAGVRVNLKAIGQVQPRWGIGFVFPVDNGARADAHWGIVTSLVFQY
ncbi:MAG TPA: hypothetical protein VN578_07970 [Candidatus Binatia bacterium]|nr:hypothetical protein [Candidatus Binatia bacterium]